MDFAYVSRFYVYSGNVGPKTYVYSETYVYAYSEIVGSGIYVYSETYVYSGNVYAYSKSVYSDDGDLGLD